MVGDDGWDARKFCGGEQGKYGSEGMVEGVGRGVSVGLKGWTFEGVD